MDSTETAIQFLTAHDWDVERAVNTALTSNSEPPTPTPPPTPPPLPTPVEPPQTERRIPPNTSVIARYMPNAALYAREKSRKSDLILYFRQLFRAPLSFLYTFYVKIQRFLPWNIFRVALTYCKLRKNTFSLNNLALYL